MVPVEGHLQVLWHYRILARLLFDLKLQEGEQCPNPVVEEDLWQ